jgi:acyl dehydratase
MSESQNPTDASSAGRYFEDFRAGERLQHALGRTVTDVDNIWLTLLTCNTNPVHFNKDYCEKFFPGPPFNGRLVVNAALTFSIIAGLSVEDTSKYGVMLGLNNMKLLNPVFGGDTLYARSDIVATRESKSRPEMGIVTIRTEGYKQDGTVVMEFERTFMVRKRGRSWQ